MNESKIRTMPENNAADGSAVSSAGDHALQHEGCDSRALTEGCEDPTLTERREDPTLTERREEIEKSLRKKFRKSIMSKFARAISDYDLLQPGDHVAVCISGGKDSMLMAKCFQELKRRNKFPFDLTFLVMDPGYADANRKMIEYNASLLGVPVTIFTSQIFDAVYTIEKSPCYLCARMRRGYLYSKAKELGCNKIALGHHYDDVIETTLMSILYSGQTQTMMPKLHSTNFEGMELIRPMYLIREDEICHWRDYNGLKFLRCACRFTEAVAANKNSAATGDSLSKRVEAKELIAALKVNNPNVEANIFRSMENIHLNAVLGYKKDGVYRHFLDEY
ncbi:MAG: tRNA 2-thiocytidine biosynthesis protein TtcA [Eubacterium sp.]|nr:tRNA 2-thiocytidine biosynthesis protein TtcA [Eubacterium sp.]